MNYLQIAWVSFCFLCISNTLIGQQRLKFQTLDYYEYIVKVDPVTNQLTTGDEPYFLPWLPQDQFGWQIQDQNYFNLFFKDRRNSPRKLNVNFREKLVLAIIKYDTHPWQLQVQEVAYFPGRHHIHLVYSGEPQYQRAFAKQTSCLLILIEQTKKIQKTGDRMLTYSVEKVGNSPELLTASGPNPTEIFPLAFTNTHITQQNGREIELAKHMQQPESLVTGKTQQISETDIRKMEMKEKEAKRLQKQKEMELRKKDIVKYQNNSSQKKPKKSQFSYNQENSKGKNRRNSAITSHKRDLYLDINPRYEEDNSRYNRLNFLETKGYMARRDIDLKAVSYLVFNNKLDWDAYLKRVPPGMTQITPISEEQFRTHMAVAVIKRGNTYWEMTPYGVWQNGGELRINYDAILTHQNLGWEATTLFVILVERGNFNRISFLQNGQKMEEVYLD